MNVLKFDGKPITKPGLYEGVPSLRYHGKDLCAGPSISSTGLRTIFNRSPKHYWHTSPLNPNAAEQEDNDAMVLGRAAHHLLLGESDFSKSYVFRPAKLNGKDWHHARTDCKEWMDAAAKTGLTVLSPAQRDAIIGMRAELEAHPMVGSAGGVHLLNGLVEHTIVWQDEETGVWLKVRPDVIPLDSDDVADLKTTSDVSPSAIENTIGAFGLHMQGALNRMAWRAVFGREMQGFTLVFVETKAPHCVEVVSLKPHDLDTGEEQCRAALRLFAKCLAEDRWPGPGGTQSDATFIEIKPWHRTQIQNRMHAIEMEIAA